MKTNRFRLDPTSGQAQLLRQVGDRVSALWNAANYTCRQAFLSGQRVPSYPSLATTFHAHPTYRALPSDVAQETLKKLSEAWQSFRQLRAQWKRGALGHRPGPPRYRKDRQTGERPTDYVPIKCGRSYRVNGRTIELTMPKDVHRGRLVVPYRGSKRYLGKDGRMEMQYDHARGRWYALQAVQVPDPPPKPWQRVGGIDLGLRVLASLSIEGVVPSFHFLGREVLKAFEYGTQLIARHQHELAHRPTSQRSSKRLKRLYAKRRDKLRHATDAMAKRIATLCRAYHVGKVVIGWPKAILLATTANRKWQRLRHNAWNFADVSGRIELALIRAGIQVERVGERGTSSHCAHCGGERVVRCPRSVVRCQDCHTVLHADQAGSRNIVRQRYPVHWARVEATLRPESHRWTEHRWVDVSNPSMLVQVEDLSAATAADEESSAFRPGRKSKRPFLLHLHHAQHAYTDTPLHRRATR